METSSLQPFFNQGDECIGGSFYYFGIKKIVSCHLGILDIHIKLDCVADLQIITSHDVKSQYQVIDVNRGLVYISRWSGGVVFGNRDKLGDDSGSLATVSQSFM